MRAKIMRRVFSVLLAALIALSLMPVTALADVTISPGPLPEGMVGIPYSATLGASSTLGESIHWSIENGSLPAGLTLGASSGRITGRPSEPGTVNFTVRAEDSGGFDTKSYSIEIVQMTVSGVLLNRDVIRLDPGETEKLTATLLPSGVSGVTVGWSSSDTSVATVSEGMVTAVAPGKADITASAEGHSATCEVIVGPGAGALVVKGTAYLHTIAARTTLGGAQIYGSTNTGTYFSAQTDAGGHYSLAIPRDQNLSSLQMRASSSFILGRLLLNEEQTAVDSGYRTVPIDKAANDVDFHFVDPPKVTGKVISSVDGPLANAKVSVWDGVETDANGNFTAQSSVYSTGKQSVYAYVSAENHYYRSVFKEFDVTVDVLKAGTSLDLGTVELTKINQGGSFGDFTKNNLSLMPSSVSSGETSNATVNVYLDHSDVLPNAQVKVRVDNGAVIRAEKDSLVRVTANGRVVKQSQYTRALSGDELTITMDLQPRTQYQITFGIKAPTSLTSTGYVAEASVNGTVIGKQNVMIHNLTARAPAEIGVSDRFNVYGEVASSGDVKLTLRVTGPTGEKINQTKETLKNVGYFYKFENLQLPANSPEGEYTVEVEMRKKQGNDLIAKASTTMWVAEKPVTVKSMLLQDDFNSVSMENPAPGSFLTFVGWVDGSVWSMDYRHLKSSVTLNNTSEVHSARFVMETTHGKFSWEAERSGDTFSALLFQYQGTGKASVSLEVKKKDGTKTTYTIGNLVILIDPSGYVYDTATGARIEGAKATLYYDAGNGWELWPADEFMQINPQLTDGEGKYGWMVPEGKYKVVVEKDGYESFDTYETLGSEYKELRVLPEQKDINIGLTPLKGSGTVTPGGSTDSDRKSSSKDRDTSVSTAAKPRETWITAATVKDSSRAAGVFGVRGSAWEKMETDLYYHDTVSKGAVQVRVSIQNPALLKKDALLSAYVSGAAVERTQKLFEKWRSNRMWMIHFDQQEDWEAPVRVAAKVNVSGADTKNLYFYAYTSTTNSYRRIQNPAYWTDKNGYLHFVTPYAGDLIISEGEL